MRIYEFVLNSLEVADLADNAGKSRCFFDQYVVIRSRHVKISVDFYF